jgi:hypothetical protein
MCFSFNTEDEEEKEFSIIKYVREEINNIILCMPCNLKIEKISKFKGPFDGESEVWTDPTASSINTTEFLNNKEKLIQGKDFIEKNSIKNNLFRKMVNSISLSLKLKNKKELYISDYIYNNTYKILSSVNDMYNSYEKDVLIYSKYTNSTIPINIENPIDNHLQYFFKQYVR